MAALDNNTLLCVLENCDIDTFLTCRRLSSPVLEFINSNIVSLTQRVARSTFPQHLEIYSSDTRATVRDISWLKCLRLRYLAAVLVECTNRNNRGTDLLNAERAGAGPQQIRRRIYRAFKLLGQLQQVSQECMSIEESDLPRDPSFQLPPFHKAVRARRGIGGDGPAVGTLEDFQMHFTHDNLPTWKRRWNILRQQIELLKDTRAVPDIISTGEGMLVLAEALLFEFTGRPQDDRQGALKNRIRKQLLDLRNRNGDLESIADISNDRFAWFWTTVLGFGPGAFWNEWYKPDSQIVSPIRQRMMDIWNAESPAEKRIKSLVGKAFFASMHRRSERAPPCLGSAPRRRMSYQPYTVFPAASPRK